MKKRILSICLLLMLCTATLAGCNKPQSQAEIVKYVEDNVPEDANVIDYKESQTNMGTEYRYTFRSESRDLEFNVFSTKGTFGGYSISEYYVVGLRNYYLEEMRPLLEACPNSDMYGSSNGKSVSVKLYMDSETDARNIAKVLAKCNEIVTEQWNYQPGADLTDNDVLGVHFNLYETGSSDISGSYYLNGQDDEDTIYNKLKSML